MALQGNYTRYYYEESPTETVEQVIAYPANLDVSNPDYDKRGTEETIVSPLLVANPTPHENCALGIRTVNLYVTTHGENFEKVVNMDYTFRVYNSIEDKKNAYDESYIAEYTNSTSIDLSVNTNVWEFAYNDIKSLEGGEELINI